MMWRTVISSTVLVFVLVSHLNSAPAYPHLRGPRYSVRQERPYVEGKNTTYHAGPYVEARNATYHAGPYVEARNATYHGGPREEARAMCSVKTSEVNATANATITRRLHGVVTSRELQSSVQRLELIIFGQMQQLWQSLDALRAQLGGRDAVYPDRRSVMFRFKPEG